MNAPIPTPVPQAPTRDLALHIEGMHCAGCVGRVERALRAVPGVARANVNLATERADIAVTEGVHRADLAKAVAGAGYQIAEETVDLSVEGMTCASCVARLESTLRTVPGVAAATVNLVTGRALVRGHADTADLVQAVAQAGFTAQVVEYGRTDDRQSRQTEAARILRRDVAIAVVLTLPIVVLEMGAHLVPVLHDLIHTSIGMQGSRVLQFVLTVLVLALPGRGFLTAGLPALVRGRPDMNSLVALGTLAAFAVSVVATFAPTLLPAEMTDVYFEPAAVIVTLVLVGRYLEMRAKGRAAGAIRALIGLQPMTARVWRGDTVVEIAIADLGPGDLVDLRPGERIPADGVVTEGRSWIDAAMVTGEANPVEAHAESALIGGTVNQTGSLTMRVTTVGAKSVLSQIIKMVEDAQGSKLPVQAMVDRVTMWFVPAVLLAAALTAAVWLIWCPAPVLSFALVNGVAVLIIACPCAMGLATPTSILAGTGRGAEMGVLFRRGDALQQLAGVKVVAFDKTGTLTVGHPVVTDVHLAAGFDRAVVLAAIAAIEARSEHPLARALVAVAEAEGSRSAAATEVIADPGQGVWGKVDDQRVEIGSAAFLQSRGVDLASILPIADTFAKAGKTPIFVASDGIAAGVLAIQDAPRPEAAAAIRALQEQGLRVVMVSGDNQQTAEAVAKTLGIAEVRAEVLPGGKRDIVRALRAAHGPVAFVGDGINDAPALAEADVGIAIGTGTDIAVEAADVVLMSGNPRLVLSAIGLSTSTMANIRQNLFWAFAYNAAMIPVAAGILYPGWGILLSPALAAGAMALSSLFVIGNALRLARYKGEVG